MESIRGGVGTDGKSSCDLGSIYFHADDPFLVLPKHYHACDIAPELEFLSQNHPKKYRRSLF